jgi:hypothetical protein
MEQRRLRLGDILDDYCPRERRVTNHAVVAMIEEDVKQTRCTTCDAEHAYKGGKAPRQRKKETSSALYKEVLAGMPEADAPSTASSPAPEPAIPTLVDVASEDAPSLVSPDVGEEPADPDTLSVTPDDGPVHRPLIRATLPRPEGQKDARPLPEFTVRQAANRGNAQFRGNARARHRAGQGGNGHRPHGGQRFAGPRQGRGQGSGGFRSAQPPRHGGGKKRSR